MNRLISIDPSINNLGLAVWNISDKNLLAYMLMHPEKGQKDNEFDKSLSMMTQVQSLLTRYAVNRMIMEIPETWAVGGFQARETGSMTKLMFVCGMLYSLKMNLEELKLVTPREHKGQLSKEVVANRLRDTYLPSFDTCKLDANVMDAIGIGHFYLHGTV